MKNQRIYAPLTFPNGSSFEQSLPSPHEGQVGSGYQNGSGERKVWRSLYER